MNPTAESRIIDVNDAWVEMLGFTKEEMVGKSLQEFALSSEVVIKYCNPDRWAPDLDMRLYTKTGDTLIISANPVMLSLDGRNYVYATMLNITQSKQLEASLDKSKNELHQMAFHDQLTGLPNRSLFLDRLQHALSSTLRSEQALCALLYIDMDNFKIINDTLGHAMGDLFLQQVAKLLTACVRECDTVARFGGDEFVVLIDNLNVPASKAAGYIGVISEKILATLNRIYQPDTHKFSSSCSMGVAMSRRESKDAEELLKRADIAMYQAKKAGRNRLCFFEPSMQQVINVRAILEEELYKAVEDQQFQLYFQIQMDSLHHPLGADALLLWTHPERGLELPSQFLPLAEETGQILAIGLWALETACEQIKSWVRDERTSNLVLSVNISAKQFNQVNFVEQVKSAVLRHAINPALLKLELTESMLLNYTQHTVDALHALQAIGVQLSLDDFGTGYSSLQYLKLLPFKQIKIDQSFVRNLATDQNHAAIVQAIIAISEALAMDVIAEGVETEVQREALYLRGCHAYQGYLFGKPVPIRHFNAALH